MELKGILQTFNKNNAVYDKAFRDLEIRLRAKTRKDKIKKIYEN
jgi:hypothetical protein